MLPNEVQNKVLGSLQSADLALLQPHLRPFEATANTTLQPAHQIVEHVYFVEEGFASILAACRGRECEVAVAGSEGMIGMPCILSDARTFIKAIVMVPSRGQMMPGSALLSAMAASSTLNACIMRYLCAWLGLATQAAVANAHATLEERLARWLLMAHDRIKGDEVCVEHELLARILGVRRVGVTVSLHRLQDQGLIFSRRRDIVVEDREGLMRIANGFYGPAEATFARLFPSH